MVAELPARPRRRGSGGGQLLFTVAGFTTRGSSRPEDSSLTDPWVDDDDLLPCPGCGCPQQFGKLLCGKQGEEKPHPAHSDALAGQITTDPGFAANIPAPLIAEAAQALEGQGWWAGSCPAGWAC
ncbi:hypothetical protein GGTG_09250 [Gaeumannomyces tritici R3-111a-1]|uniref:Uncharacterized protein n=1 Tax=Gaeumannomyces tritici (strain R3-111a-1) TaxID=644352 RepID=J3P6V8_GAET3|nr:hypothetical protein GGTG_09250 [Gaeumannomyces tritici R3-111a-1]EJT72384.1 hypothetical protein GGTG_09250 [Gaeumannomyces tritici R3-111a-1]